jgi:hypothetical protein
VALDPSKPKLRIISGEPAQVEREVNLLFEQDYAPIQWAFGGSEKPWVTVLLLVESELRKALMMAAPAARPFPGRPH